MIETAEYEIIIRPVERCLDFYQTILEVWLQADPVNKMMHRRWLNPDVEILRHPLDQSWPTNFYTRDGKLFAVRAEILRAYEPETLKYFAAKEAQKADKIIRETFKQNPKGTDQCQK